MHQPPPRVPPRYVHRPPNVAAPKHPPPIAQNEWAMRQARLRAEQIRRTLEDYRSRKVLTPAWEESLQRDLRDAMNDEKLARARVRASHLRYILPLPIWNQSSLERSRSAPAFLRVNEPLRFAPVLQADRVWNAELGVWEVDV